jgi:signal transduction histidine kinase
MVSGIVIYSRATQLPIDQKEEINVAELITEVTGLLNLPPNTKIRFEDEGYFMTASRVVIKQILLQLLHNAVQYNDRSKIKIEIKFHENKHSYTFEVKDNGRGIADEDKEKIFNLFERLQKKINDGESMGIGLAIVKRLIEKTGGEIKLDSELKKGSTFVFTIPK